MINKKTIKFQTCSNFGSFFGDVFINSYTIPLRIANKID